MSVLFPIFHDGRTRLLTFDAAGGFINPLSTSIEDVVKWAGERDPVAIGSWRELSAEEYSRSFAVAQSAGYSIVGDLHREFKATIESQGTEQDFADRVLPILQRKGWLAGTGQNVARRVQLIYDTNLRVARAAGQWQRYQRTARSLPYLRAVTARDDRVRRPPHSDSDHTAFDGIVLPISHGFWARWFPPLGFRCRCSVIQMTRSQLARSSFGITGELDLAQREARLGVPIFNSPGSFNGQIASIVGLANDNKIPGQAAMSIRTPRFLGERLLQSQLIDEAVDEIGDFLNRIFGKAA